MEELRAKVLQFLQVRLGVDEAEAGILADDLFLLHQEILNGAGPDQILAHAEKFLSEHPHELRFQEQRPVPVSRRNSYAVKRRTQLDFFPVPQDKEK